MEDVYDRRTSKPRSDILKEHFTKEGRIQEEVNSLSGTTLFCHHLKSSEFRPLQCLGTMKLCFSKHFEVNFNFF